MLQTSWLEVDLGRLDNNLRLFRRLVGDGVKICGVIKADAYSLGAVPLANRLEAGGIDSLAVYSPAQAAEIYNAGLKTPLIILLPVRQPAEVEGLEPAFKSGQFHLTIHDEDQLLAIDKLAHTLECQMPVHLYLDTGMSRAGLNPEQFARVLSFDQLNQRIRVAGVYTHFTSSDDDPEFTNHQMDLFRKVLKRCKRLLPADVLIHASNTCATLRGRPFHHSMVRIGLGLYGYGPQFMTEPGENIDLQPIVQWLSRVVHVQQYPQGTTVGYNRTHCLSRDSLLGVVPAGYGDGYPLALTGRGSVEVGLEPARGRSVPILGKVNMDQVVIDLTDCPVPVGTVVRVISWDNTSPCALHHLAHQAESTCYEMLCRLPPRLQRTYLS